VTPQILQTSPDLRRKQNASPRQWVLPDEPRPLRLINTLWADRVEVHDDLSTVVDLRSWLSDIELHVPKSIVALSSLATIHDLRHAFRALAAFVTSDNRIRLTSDQSITAAIRTVNIAAGNSVAAVQLRLQSSALERVVVRPGTPLESAFSVLANEAIALCTSGDRERLTACGGPGCVLYFMKDHTRRNWCGDACGNRARAARHYRKVRETTEA
jgi:predicted RNA-binding Zn ribbon-like protein